MKKIIKKYRNLKCFFIRLDRRTTLSRTYFGVILLGTMGAFLMLSENDVPYQKLGALISLGWGFLQLNEAEKLRIMKNNKIKIVI